MSSASKGCVWFTTLGSGTFDVKNIELVVATLHLLGQLSFDAIKALLSFCIKVVHKFNTGSPQQRGLDSLHALLLELDGTMYFSQTFCNTGRCGSVVESLFDEKSRLVLWVKCVSKKHKRCLKVCSVPSDRSTVAEWLLAGGSGQTGLSCGVSVCTYLHSTLRG